MFFFSCNKEKTNVKANIDLVIAKTNRANRNEFMSWRCAIFWCWTSRTTWYVNYLRKWGKSITFCLMQKLQIIFTALIFFHGVFSLVLPSNTIVSCKYGNPKWHKRKGINVFLFFFHTLTQGIWKLWLTVTILLNPNHSKAYEKIIINHLIPTCMFRRG